MFKGDNMRTTIKKKDLIQAINECKSLKQIEEENKSKKIKTEKR